MPPYQGESVQSLAKIYATFAAYQLKQSANNFWQHFLNEQGRKTERVREMGRLCVAQFMNCAKKGDHKCKKKI